MAYQVNIRKPDPVDGAIVFKGTTQYFEIEWSGFATDDIIKVETSVDGSAFVSQYQFDLGAASGTKKAIVGPLDLKTSVVRAKSYDSDGTTPLSGGVPLDALKVGWKANVKNTKVDKISDVDVDISDLADKVQFSGLNVALPKTNLFKKDLYNNSMNDTYDAIQAADANQTDIIRYPLSSITWNNSNRASYGTEKYPLQVRRGIEFQNTLLSASPKTSKWVINGTAMSVPHWINKNYIYTFLSSDKAKKCQKVLVSYAAKRLIKRKRLGYASASNSYIRLTAGVTTIDANITEQIADI